MSGLPFEEEYVAYSPIIDRPPVRWPNGARVALWLAPNVEFYEYLPTPTRYADQWPRTPHPDVMTYSYRDSGNRAGFWRMLEVFDRHHVRATVSINVAVLEHFPEIRDAMVERDWDFMSHGVYNTRYLYGMSVEEEREFYRYTCEVIARQTGKTLRGMLGPAFTATPNTPNLMAEAGLRYHVDWFIDDQPFPIKVDTGLLCGVPYSRLLNDALLFSGFSYEADYFLQICKDQFDVLYAEGAHSGRVMCIALHPYLIGQPHRIKYLDQVLDYILSHEGVWATTADEIAEWYLQHHHADHLARLTPAPSRV
jgi:peptidoglycan/xylan/chitin deacetylase (PgdA/CDA1 family)